MATTTIGPISTQQINDVFYVSDEGFPTIQAAVDYATRYNAGLGEIVIQQGYTGTETIASIVNGNIWIFISDQRNTSAQTYAWSDTFGYMPDYFEQFGPIVTTGTFDAFPAPKSSIALVYDPSDPGGGGGGGISVFSTPGGRTPSFSLNLNSDVNGAIAAWQVGADAEGLNLLTNLRSSVHIFEDLTVDGPISTKQINNFFFVDSSGSLPTIQAAVDYITKYNAGLGIVVIGQGYTGAEVIGNIVNGNNWIYIQDRRNTSAQDYAWSDTFGYMPDYFEQFGPIVTTGTFDAFPAPKSSIALVYDPSDPGGGGGGGISVFSTPGGRTPSFSLNLISDLNGTIPAIQIGGDATGLNLTINLRSSVQVFENLTVDGDFSAATADITGALTAGSAAIGGPLSATSAAFDSCVVDGSDVRTFANTPVAALPPAGIGVSTGLAWGPSIDPATLAYINKPNTFTGTQTFTRDLHVGLGGAFITGDNAGSMTINGAGGGGVLFNWFSGNAGVTFGDGNANAVGSVDRVGNATFDGTLNVAGNAEFNGTLTTGNAIVSGINLTNQTAGNGARLATLYQPNQTGGISFIGMGVSDADCVIFGYATGGGGLIGGLNRATFDVEGNWNFPGSLTAGGAKNFRILHPLNAKKWLTHSCIEGPEVAVFYRGEVRCAKFTADVKLPDYFEALCEKKGRTVQLTQIDNGKDLAMLSATRVEDGKFRIRATVADALVCWEVKAVRAGVAVEVVSERREAEHDFGTDGAGTHKDGKLRAKAPNKSTGTTAKPRRAR